MSLVLVQDTLYNAEGQLANGYIALTWPTFTAADNHVVQGSATPLIIPIANGVLSVSLEPCAGSTPSGVTYTANYNLGTPSSTPEFWNVPGSGPVNLATIRTNPQPPVTYSTLPTSSLTGVITVAQGGTGQTTLFPQGSVIFAGAGGAYSGDNANLSYNTTSHDLMVGGNTDGNYRLDVQKSGSSGTARVYDQTAATGVTQFVLRSGAGQGSTPLMSIEDNSGTLQAYIDQYFEFGGIAFISQNNLGVGTILGSSGSPYVGVNFSNSRGIAWSSTASWGDTADVGLSRISAGVLGVGNGTVGDFSGDIEAGTLSTYSFN